IFYDVPKIGEVGFKILIPNYLQSMCKNCKIREKGKCGEYFYGIRLENLLGSYNIRLCVHKSTPATYYRFSEFKYSSVFKELKGKVMKELEVRFSLADKKDYHKVIEFLNQNYQFESENRQIDKYYKERGKETEEDVPGSYIYRFRQVNDLESGVFTRKDTVKPGFWKEDEIVLE